MNRATMISLWVWLDTTQGSTHVRWQYTSMMILVQNQKWWTMFRPKLSQSQVSWWPFSYPWHLSHAVHYLSCLSCGPSHWTGSPSNQYRHHHLLDSTLTHPYGYRIFYKAVGATGPPQSVVVNDSSATSYDLTVSQGDVNYTISMQTLSATQLSSAVTEEVLSAGNF